MNLKNFNSKNELTVDKIVSKKVRCIKSGNSKGRKNEKYYKGEIYTITHWWGFKDSTFGMNGFRNVFNKADFEIDFIEKLDAQTIISKIDKRVVINFTFKDEHIYAKLNLPQYKLDSVICQIEEYITNGKTLEECISTEQCGGDFVSCEELETFIANFKKKYLKLARNPIDKWNKFPIRVYSDDYNIALKCKVEYTKPELIKLAKGIMAQAIFKYKAEYEQMILIQKTLEKT